MIALPRAAALVALAALVGGAAPDAGVDSRLPPEIETAKPGPGEHVPPAPPSASVRNRALATELRALLLPVKACLERHLRRNIKLTFRGPLELEFDEAGVLVDVRFDHEANDPAVVRCVTRSLLGRSISKKSAGRLVIRYPMFVDRAD